MKSREMILLELFQFDIKWTNLRATKQTLRKTFVCSLIMVIDSGNFINIVVVLDFVFP